MNSADEINSFVMSFFQKIGADTIQGGGLYRITIPEKYHRYFKSSEIAITFDKDVARANTCHLMIPGSSILYDIITICRQKGPILIKKSDTAPSITIRYHFYVDFSGVSNVSQLEYVDVPIHRSAVTDDSLLFGGTINPKNIAASYLTALEKIKKLCKETREEFLDDANRRFNRDFELFADKYDEQMRELDESINARERNSDDSESIAKFRFRTVDMIKEIEQEKSRLVHTLQEKHKITLEYGLVACEIVS